MQYCNRPAKGLLAYLANSVCETRPKENAAEQSAAFFLFCGPHDAVGVHSRLCDGPGALIEPTGSVLTQATDGCGRRGVKSSELRTSKVGALPCRTRMVGP
jgi:hypothetical protein